MKFATYLALTGAVSANKTTDIVTGLMKGAFGEDSFGGKVQCIKDAKELVAEAETTYKDVKAKDYGDAIKEAKMMVTTVKAALADCKKETQQVKLEAMAQALDKPASLSWEMDKEVVVNGADILPDLETAVEMYEEKNWEKFGEAIGNAAAKVNLGTEMANLDKKTQVAEIFEGLAKSYGNVGFDLMAFLFCVQAEDKALLEFDAAVHTFISAWQTKSIGDAIGGVIILIAAIQQVQQGLPACKAAFSSEDFLPKLEQSLNIASHPLEYFELLEDDVKINGKSIVADGMAATDAYLAKDFVTFGEKVGNILQLATKEEKKETIEYASEDAKAAAEVLQGFLTATNVGSFNFTALLVCIYQMDQAAIEFVAALNLIKEGIHDKSIMEGVMGAIFTFAAFQQFRKSLPVCAAIDESTADWTTFDQILSVLEDPKDNLKVIEKDVVMNGVTITEDFTEAMEAINEEEYRDFGFLLGQTMTLATMQEKNLFLY